MLQAETLCGIRDGDGYCFGSPGNLQKQLMLLGLQPCADRCALAEVQKQTQLTTEIGEYAKKGMIARGIVTSTHIYIVPRYKYDAGELTRHPRSEERIAMPAQILPGRPELMLAGKTAKSMESHEK